MKPLRKTRGFTLIETLIVIVIIAVVSTVGFQAFRDLRMRANQAASTTNLRQIAAANLLYAADHFSYCPFGDPTNRIRWHGGRDSAGGPFDPEKGYLSEYLGQSRRVGICPQLAPMLTDESSWEDGSGGYGYNDTYIGSMPGASFQANRPANVPRPDRTLMFATTALAKSSGLQEYPGAASWRSVTHRGTLGGSLQPTVHFRFNGKALIAWCDGHITEERPSDARDDKLSMAATTKPPTSASAAQRKTTAGGIRRTKPGLLKLTVSPVNVASARESHRQRTFAAPPSSRVGRPLTFSLLHFRSSARPSSRRRLFCFSHPFFRS